MVNTPAIPLQNHPREAMVTPAVRLSLPAFWFRLPRPRASQPRTLAILALASANVLWAGSVVASKPTLSHMPPMTMAALRVAIALVVLRIILARRHEQPATGSLPAFLGFTGVTLFCACQNLGLLFADATTTALLGGVIPVLTVCLAVPILHERLDGPRVTGILVSLLGIAVITLLGTGQAPGTALLENLLPMASAVSSAIAMVLGRCAFRQGNSLAMVAGSTQYGLLCLLPGAAFELARDEPTSLTVQDGLLLLYLGVGCSAVAPMLRGYGLAHLEAGQGAVYGNLRPLAGVALAVLILDEPLAVNQIGGGLLILAGVGIASRQWRPVRRRCQRLLPVHKKQWSHEANCASDRKTIRIRRSTGQAMIPSLSTAQEGDDR
jgi:drug/metabolite transporter (DMT)-like permease